MIVQTQISLPLEEDLHEWLKEMSNEKKVIKKGPYVAWLLGRVRDAVDCEGVKAFHDLSYLRNNNHRPEEVEK